MSTADVQVMDLSGTAAATQWSALLVSLSDTWNNDPRAVWSSFAMILASEVGDKTFLIAAILSMRQPRLIVFLGAFSALALMSILSSFLGATFPSLLPKSLTTFSAAVLFFVFGLKMLKEAREMTGEEMNEEMEEARKEVEDESHNWNSSSGNNDEMELRNVEEGINTSNYPELNLYPKSPNPNLNRNNDIIFDQDRDENPASTSTGNGDSNPSDHLPKSGSHSTSNPKTTKDKSSISRSADHLKEGARNLCGLCFSPVFAQAFVLTFLGEWGDRSQIATIALAAAHNVALVSLGTIGGHAICTGLAVLGGSALAARISVKHVTFGGSILFLLFGVIYLFESFSEYKASTSIPSIASPGLSDDILPSPVEKILAQLGGAAAGIQDPQAQALAANVLKDQAAPNYDNAAAAAAALIAPDVRRRWI